MMFTLFRDISIAAVFFGVLVGVDSVYGDVPVVDTDSVDPLINEDQQDHKNEVLPAFQLCDGNSTPNARGLLEEVDPANNVPPNSEEKRIPEQKRP